MVKQYLCCFNLDTGVTLIGLLHLNAALWFLWRFTIFQPVYCWFDLLICVVFAARTGTFLHGCFKDDMFATVKSRVLFHKVNLYCTLALATLILAQLITSWADLGTFPLLSFLGWLTVGGINVYHWIVIKSFANFED